MATNVKFSILENNGNELGVGTERFAIADDIFYDDNRTETVKDKLDRSLQNFSYKKIVAGESVTIPENQQMIVKGRFTIFAGGELIINTGGELVLW
jgi:hypothetical protein